MTSLSIRGSPRVYDALDPDRTDLEVYAQLAHELGANRVLDVGCGTGTFALLLAERGLDVIGVDPAGGSLNVARAKPGADRVRWIHGDVRSLPSVQVDLTTMTGNVAQAIVDQRDWGATLGGVRAALRPGGPSRPATRCSTPGQWNRATSYTTTEIEGVGKVESWVEVTDISGPLVSFRWTWVLDTDGELLTSDSTLRFRDRDEVEAALIAHGYVLDAVRDAPD